MDKAQDLTRTYKFTKIDIDIEQGRINFQKNEISSMQLLFFQNDLVTFIEKINYTKYFNITFILYLSHFWEKLNFRYE